MARRATITQKRIGLYLNGSDSVVTVPAAYIIPQSFSIALWYKPVGITSNDRVVDQQDAGPANGFTLNMSTTGSPQISFATRNVGTSEANVVSRTMNKGDWNFVAATFTTNSAILYVNAVSTGTPDTACIMTAPAATLTIGRRSPTATNYAKGYIDDFMVFSKVLTTAEIADLFNGARTALDVGSCDIWYKFDELSGTNIVDSSGNARHGTRGGSATANPTVWFTEPGVRLTVPTAKSAKALNFANLPTAVISIADTATLRPETTSTFTWATWVYLDSTRNNVLPRFCEKGAQFWCFMGDQTNGKANQLAVEISNTDNTTTEYWGSTKLQTGQWYHIATTFDGSGAGECQHYVNGEKEAMQTLLGPYAQIKSTTGSTLVIGNNHSNTRNPQGLMSDFRYHNVILTQDEIKQIMRTNDVTRGLVGKWNMDEGTGTNVADSSGNGYNGTITAATWKSIINSRTTI